MPDSRRAIVITGASSGIGAALALRMGAAGWRLALGARRENELRAIAGKAASDAVAVVGDVTRRADVERLRDEALAAFGAIDVWINNAGRGIARNVLDLTDHDFDQMMAVNVKSALYGMQSIVPYFIERGQGHVINVSSFLGRVPLASHRSAYNAAKAALNALTANLRVDLAVKHPGIHVSLVMPGLVSTEFAHNAIGSSSGGAPPSWTSAGGALPAGAMKPQTAEEVAEAIANLIEHPAAEIYTNPASSPLARRYYEDVGAFEAGMAKS
jgi:NAD(P)-dependent dehydrogenase (short-subunit alcohol dehydrogenase family)